MINNKQTRSAIEKATKESIWRILNKPEGMDIEIWNFLSALDWASKKSTSELLKIAGGKMTEGSRKLIKFILKGRLNEQ